MSYVPPFERIRQIVKVTTVKDQRYVNTTYDEFIAALKLLLRGIAVDETWYLRTYPDVAQAIKKGTYKSARHHFIEEGYFEGRRPGVPEIDETWYCETYPDVAEGIKAGTIDSAQNHFVNHGYQEGRLPAAY